MFDYLDRRRRLRRQRARRAAGLAVPARRCSSVDKRAAHRRQRLRPLRRGRHARPQVRAAHLPHQLARGLRLPVAVHRVAALPAPRAWPASTASWCRSRSTSTPSTGSTALNLTSFELEEFFESVAETRDADSHVRGRHRQQGRARAVREVLPQLHAQAVGPRSVGARRRGHRARAGAHQPRRSLLHRHLPGDAAARLHADVRADARLIRTSRSCSTPTTARSRTSIPYGEMIYTGPDRRVLRLPLRQAAVPLAGVQVRDAQRRRRTSRRRWSTTRTRTPIRG